MEDAGLDIDFDAADAELAAIQAASAARAAAEAGTAGGNGHGDGTAVLEGQVTGQRTVEFRGKTFRVASKIGLMPMLKFATYANMSTADPRALAAIYQMLRDCIHQGTPGCGQCAACTAGDETGCKAYDKGDWQAFEDHAVDTKADADELLDVMNAAMAVVAGRPPGQLPSSSPGPRGMRGASTARSSARRAKASKHSP